MVNRLPEKLLLAMPLLALCGCASLPWEPPEHQAADATLPASQVLAARTPPAPAVTPTPLPPGTPQSPAPDPVMLAQATETAAAQSQKGDQLPAPREVSPGKKATDSAADTSKPAVDLKPPPAEAGDVTLPINLAAALQLSDARPLIVAAALASLNVAEQQLFKARVLWVPTLDIGAAYYRHDGIGPDPLNGLSQPQPTRELYENTNWLYLGGGLNNSVIHNVQTTDMIYEPLARRQELQARVADVQAAKNDALMQTAEAYYRVHQYRGRYAGALDAVDRSNKLVERIDLLSRDLVPKVEIDRARRLREHLRQQAQSALEEYRVASADLTLVLRLDPRVVVQPMEHDHLQLTLIDPARTLDELMPIGIRTRPEIASQLSMVEAARARIRQEQMRPLLPTLFINGFQSPQQLTQGGYLLTGHAGNMNLGGWRDDFNLLLQWQLQNFGLGNRALIQRARAEQQQILIRLNRAQDKVVEEITESLANIKSAAARVDQADRALREAVITYDGNYEGLGQTTRLENLLIQVYRPQEAVIALQHLNDAYFNYFDTVAEYNQAQFKMFHSLGYPAAEISKLRPPGVPSPVNTDRPEYLPPVMDGPPPPTR